MDYSKFFNGEEIKAYELFGAHPKNNGVEFYLWAPNAYKVQVFTSKNWDEFFDLEKIDNRGIWYLYLEDFEYIYSYRYRIYKDKNTYHDKADPFAYYFERRPSNASCMYNLDYFKYSDDLYMAKRKLNYDSPMNIYELHLNGFKKDDELASYKDLKETLIPYVKEMGYTHIELMPVFEHPFDGSWGYQATGFFAATSRYGTPYDLMDFINECHLNNIGVLLDVVYVHFATDDFGLRKFDFTNQYEIDTKSEWGTCYFDLGKGPVISFLMSSANFFLQRYHFDGLRFDAVSHFIYNQGNGDKGFYENGISFIKRLNYLIKEENPTCLLIAEDSSAYPNVTKSTLDNGLGFDYKWDLGWMNDTLKYYSMDPVYRKYHHHDLTFSMAYFYSERFILPFSHDEVVHSKATIIDKMWGLYDDKFRQCRNLFVYMFTHPGKKLNFLGNDIAMFREFDEKKEVDWFLLKYPMHDSFKKMFKDLTTIYNRYPAFYRNDYNYEYFKWIDADNANQSIYSYFRKDDDNCFVTILNMTPCKYEKYRVGIPYAGSYEEILNSEDSAYSGSGFINKKPIKSVRRKAHGYRQSINIKIAPFSAMIFKVDISERAYYDLNEVKRYELNA